jgi:ABC-type uncharacterized transport system fused permease/ATPase subunit
MLASISIADPICFADPHASSHVAHHLIRLHAAGFYKAVGEFVVIICVAAPLFSFCSWVEDRLVLAWRAYLTRVFLRAYFKQHAYFRIRCASAPHLYMWYD